ncbi:MAG: hypothetical protein U0270_17700 [Labilithrix sp.]
MVAQATSEVRIAGRLSTGDRARIETSGGGLTAKDLRIEISGQNGTTGALSASPKAMTLGNDTVVRALVLAPYGTLQTGHRTNAMGALFGRDVLVNLDARVTFQDGFVSQGCGSCDDQNPCTSDACNAGACQHSPVANSTSCDDHNACTTSDSCQNGACVGSNAVVCQALDICHVAGICDPTTGTCSNPAKANGTACGSNACSPNDHCEGGVCVAGPTTTCNPSDACHVAGTCNAATGVCSNPAAPAGAPCGDSNACTGIEHCDGLGACVPGVPPSIDDANPCTIDACDPVLGVTHTPVPAGTACANGDRCDGDEVCDGAGACVAGTPPTLTDGNPCTDDACDPATGVTHVPRPAGDLACNDSNACNGLEACDGAGTCIPGPPPSVDDQNICTVDGCSPISGPFHTPIAGCDPTPTVSDERFETRASILGQVVDRTGSPITGATFSVYDDRHVGAPRSDVVARVGADGSFRLRLTTFPESEPERSPVHRLVLVVEAPGRLPAERVTYARPGDAVPVGTIRLIPRDPQITNIGPAGGTASDSSNRIQVVIPPGALTTTVPIQITPFDQREDFPAPLPSSTLTMYGMELEPTGTLFAVPVTVRIANTLSLPTSATIPVGFYNLQEGHWDTLGEATWDGSRFAFQTTHFTEIDGNSSRLLDLVARWWKSTNHPNKGAERCGTGSNWGVGGGSMSDRFALPTVQAGGESFGVALQYNSGLAGSRTAGTAPPPSSSASAVPSSTLGVTVGGMKVTMECVSRAGSGGGGGGGGGTTNTPGGCGGSAVVGTCGGGVGMSFGRSSLGLSSSTQSPPPANATEMTDGSSWIEVPYVTDGSPSSTTPLARTSFFPQLLSLTAQTSATCAGGGGGAAATFGAANPLQNRATVPVGQGPLTTVMRRVLVHHRFTSPYGSGWAVDAASRVYVDGDHAVLVGGDGREEEFHPRARLDVTGLESFPTAASLTRDAVTGESFIVFPSLGTIERLVPSTGARTVVANTGLPNVRVDGLAVAYVGSTRHFVIANRDGVWDLAPGASPRALRNQVVNGGVFRRQSIAARGSTVFYTTGDGDTDRDVLFKFDLTGANPVAELVSAHAGPSSDLSLYPTRPLGEVTFTALKGLAFGPDGSLYIADSARHMIYRARPDANGLIGSTSRVEGVVGNGNSTGLAPNGEAAPGEEFTLNQPTHLAMSEDGYLFIAHSLGVAVYDTQSKEAEMLFVDGGRDEILPFFTEQSTPLPSFLPFTKNALMAMSDSGLARVNIDLLSSEADPTRTIVRNASGGFTLTDTSQAIVDKFDVRGRLIEHRRRTGKLLYAIQYSDADSDRIDRITNATGGAFVFAYDSGKLSRITDPAGAGSAITVDAQGDLTQIVEPDGEKHRFVYDRHHVTVKTDPRGDETHYTYATDGTLASTLKPTGEAHELHASISAPAAYTAGGKLQTTSSFTDPHGVVHTFVQNDYGEIEKETFVADGVTYTHDAVIPDQLFTTGGTEPFILRRANAFRRISQWTLNGVPLTNPVSFDSLGRVVSSARQGSGSGNVTRWTYDANGWLSSESPGGALLAQFIERDSDGRILRIYDAGRGSGGASPTGRETTFAWRPDDQPLSVRTHNVTTTFAYDDAGGTKNLLATSDSTGRSMTYVRDARGNAISSTDGTASAFFDFDSNNRLMRSSDALGNETTFSYEHSSCGCSAQDLVTGIHTPDLPAGVGAFAYGPNGRLDEGDRSARVLRGDDLQGDGRARDGEGPPRAHELDDVRPARSFDGAHRCRGSSPRAVVRAADGRRVDGTLPQCGQRLERRAEHEPHGGAAEWRLSDRSERVRRGGLPGAHRALPRRDVRARLHAHVRHRGAADEPLRPGEPRDHLDLVLERRRGRHVR